MRKLVLLFITFIWTSLLINFKSLFLNKVPFKRPVSVKFEIHLAQLQQPELFH